MSASNKVAVITGAGSGIGRAVALKLQAAGYDVALAGRRLEELEKTAAAAPPGAGGRMLAVATDVADEKSVASAFAATRDAFGRIDVLFNNAGAFAVGKPLDEIELADWRRVVDVNLTGAFLCAREAIRIMKAQSPKGGRIINNGSISAARRQRAVHDADGDEDAVHRARLNERSPPPQVVAATGSLAAKRKAVGEGTGFS